MWQTNVDYNFWLPREALHRDRKIELKTNLQDELDTNQTYIHNGYCNSVLHISHEIFYFQRRKKLLIDHTKVKHFVHLRSIYIQNIYGGK